MSDRPKTSGRWLYGWHPVTAVLRRHPRSLQRLLITEPLPPELAAQLKPPFTPEHSSRAELDAILGKDAVHQGIAAFCQLAIEATEADLFAHLEGLSAPAAKTLLLLDRVQDPRNLGACLRVADAAGCLGIVLEKRQSAPLSASAMKSASGSLLPLYRTSNLVRLMTKLKVCDFWIYGANAQSADSIYNTKIHQPTAWVLGGEGRGLRPLVKKHCDVLVQIPMYGSVSSLNLSVAAALCLFEGHRPPSLKRHP